MKGHPLRKVNITLMRRSWFLQIPAQLDERFVSSFCRLLSPRLVFRPRLFFGGKPSTMTALKRRLKLPMYLCVENLPTNADETLIVLGSPRQGYGNHQAIMKRRWNAWHVPQRASKSGTEQWWCLTEHQGMRTVQFRARRIFNGSE